MIDVLRVGHATFTTPDLERQVAYYSDVLGPWMITPDELPNPADVPFTLHVNDEKRQESNTSFLIFDIPKLIEFASKFYTLYPGDLYYTGTPEGVGPVKPGDWISLKSVPQLGELKIQVRAHEIKA